MPSPRTGGVVGGRPPAIRRPSTERRPPTVDLPLVRAASLRSSWLPASKDAFSSPFDALANRPNHLPLRRIPPCVAPCSGSAGATVSLTSAPWRRAASIRRLSAALCASTAADAAGERARARVGEMTGGARGAAPIEAEDDGRTLFGGEGEAEKDKGRRRGGEVVFVVALET